MDTKQAQQVGWHLVGGAAALPLPEQCVQIVRLAQYGSLADIEGLADGLEVQEASCQLQIRVGDVSVGIFGSDEPVDDFLGPTESPYQRSTLVPLPGCAAQVLSCHVFQSSQKM